MFFGTTKLAAKPRDRLPERYQGAWSRVENAVEKAIEQGLRDKAEDLGDGFWSLRLTDPPIEVSFIVEGKVVEFQAIHAVHLAREDAPVFMSYSSQDRKWFEEVRKKLKILEPAIRVWTDYDIPPGKNWMKFLQEEAHAAWGAVLLVSEEYLDSKIVETVELPILLGRSCDGGTKEVFWVLVRSVDIEALKKKNGKPNDEEETWGEKIFKLQAGYKPPDPLANLSKLKRSDRLDDLNSNIMDVLDPRGRMN